MEFNEKLQELRKQKGLTQQELAEALYVSRTAISKWESGRGYPNIDSLKAIAGFFSVTVDELLSGDELLNIAEEDAKRKTRNFRDLIFGLLDLCTLLLLFLPLFGQRTKEEIQAVSLLHLDGTGAYLNVAYFAVIILSAVWGITVLALQNYNGVLWNKLKNLTSLILTTAGLLLFIISSQPYAAVLFFIFLIIKASSYMTR
ncbi:MAG: helix-turn-helix transcriptional regulator [Ruminococcaceae bacterium]|nr:helix-turn-helix transcriptional regulator [Oscillospiraceae bacterium]